jgi:hypothetical protein
MADRYGVPTIRGDDPMQTFRLQSALMRQRQGSPQGQLAKAMMQQGSSTAPVDHWMQGLARAVQGALGGYLGKMDEREGRESEAQMLLDMQGQQGQRQAQEAAQLAQAGVPGFQMPMPNPEPGVAYPQPTAPAGGGAEVVPPVMLAPAPQPATKPVGAEMIASLMRLGAEGNQTAARAAPGFQFQYEDAEMKAAEARQEAAAAAREARMSATANRETYGQPVVEMVDGKPALVRYGNLGGRQVVPGATPEPAPAPGVFDGKSIEGQSYNILLAPNADPSSPIYGAAYQKLYGPRQIQQADGTVITVVPTPPQGIRPPVSVGADNQPPATPQPAAAGAGAPPATTTQVPGATITQTGASRLSPLTEAQSKANLFGLAMMEGNRILTELKEPPSPAAIIAWRNLPEGGINFGLSEKDQKYFNALRQFAAGVLRKETGAAFTPNELLDVQSRFFTMPGDGPSVQAQKARAREQAIAAMNVEIPGGFRGQIAPPAQPGLAGAQPPPAGAGGIPTISDPAEAMRLPPGTVFRTPDGTTRRVPAR